MQIKPSTVLRNNYNEISMMCKESSEPIYITKNGEGDLVVMGIDAFHEKEELLQLNEELQNIRERRLNGETGYTVEESLARVKNAIK